MKKEKRMQFGLNRAEIRLLLDTLPFDITSMNDVLRDPGYSAKEQKQHRMYVKDLKNFCRRLRRMEA